MLLHAKATHSESQLAQVLHLIYKAQRCSRVASTIVSTLIAIHVTQRQAGLPCIVHLCY